MVKKPRSMRTALRAASKVQERELQAKAAALAEDPGKVVPQCLGHRSHFAAAQRGIAKVWAVRDQPKKLAFRTKWGPPLARAFAATLLVASSDAEQIILLQVPTAFGKVPVAMRGKAKRDHAVGLQYFDDRKLRLYIILDLVTKKGLHFYSLPEGGIACGGKSAEPPAEFVAAEAKDLGLLKDPEGWACAHAIHAAERLVLHWKPARAKFRKCAACAKEGNTLYAITQHVAAPKVLDGFEVSVDLEPLPQQGSARVELPRSVPLDPAALERYRKNDLDDAGLLAAQRAARLAHLRTLPGPLFANNGVVYGKDLEAFVASLNPTPLEATALRGALDGWDGTLVAERGTPSKVLGEVWKERGLAALEAVAGSAQVAQQIFDAHDIAGKGVGPALQQAQARGSKHATDAALPSYRDLPPAPAFADKVARAHRAHGRAAALAALDQGDARLKGLQHAFERALGAGGKEWKYSPLEQDLAAQLLPYAEALLKAAPSEYHAALQALAHAAGVSEDLRRV